MSVLTERQARTVLSWSDHGLRLLKSEFTRLEAAQHLAKIGWTPERVKAACHGGGVMREWLVVFPEHCWLQEDITLTPKEAKAVKTTQKGNAK